MSVRQQDRLKVPARRILIALLIVFFAACKPSPPAKLTLTPTPLLTLTDTLTAPPKITRLPSATLPPPKITQPPPVTVPPTEAIPVNLVAGMIELTPAQPICAQTYNVGFDVTNSGSQATTAGGTVTLVDTRVADGKTLENTFGSFPVLQPKETYRVNMPLTSSTWYDEQHKLTLVIDPSNEIPEANETDNTNSIIFVLLQGNCP